MLELQRRGCHNINLVTGTHFVPQTLAALVLAAADGLHIPLVYNCAGYEEVETLQLLDGVVDIYLPDAKYADDENAREFSGFPTYVEANRAALREMYRQVGELEVDEAGIATRGMIIPAYGPAGRDRRYTAGAALDRHGAFPDRAREPAGAVLSRPPGHRASPARRKLTWEEYDAACAAFEEAGLENGWLQELEEES